MDSADLDLRHGESLPSSNPHKCVYVWNGADSANCAEFSGVFKRNVDGCCRVSCNAKNRKCFKCVEEGSKPVNTVVDPNRGLCATHQQLADHPPAVRVRQPMRVPVFGEPRSDVIVRRGNAGAKLAPEEATDELSDESGPKEPDPELKEPEPPEPPNVPKPAASETPTYAAISENVAKLNPRRRLMFKYSGLGLDNERIAEKLNTSKGTVGVEFATVYKIMGVGELPRAEKRVSLAQAAKTYFASDPDFAEGA